jgi:hypothetical protein
MNTATTEAPTSALAEYNRTAAELADLRQRFAGVVWDVATTKGNAEARAARRRALWLGEQAQEATAPIPMQPVPAAADEQATIKLGDICARIAPLSISAAGLAELGIVHSDTDKAAKLYRHSDLPRIRDALVRHVVRTLGEA